MHNMNDDDEDTVRVIRIRLDRVGYTILMIVCCVYAGLSAGWLGAAGFLPAMYYQWKYYMTHNDCVRMAELIEHMRELHDALRAALKTKGRDHGSDAK